MLIELKAVSIKNFDLLTINRIVLLDQIDKFLQEISLIWILSSVGINHFSNHLSFSDLDILQPFG